MSQQKVKNNADFLYLFSEADGFKFLTHDFLLPEDSDFLKYLANCRSLLLKYDGLIEETLFELIFGFLYGPSWIDSQGLEHTFYCSSKECIEWSLSHPHLHPKSNEAFEQEFDKFRKSIRFYQMDLQKYVESICKDKFPTFNYSFQNLRRGNLYINVRRLGKIFERILQTMKDSRFYANRNVIISYERCEPQDNYLIAKIIIEQQGSLSDSVLARSVEQRVRDGGGDLGTIRELVEDTCYWSVESIWQDGPARINLVPQSTDVPCIESLPKDAIGGFRHILTIPHRTI